MWSERRWQAWHAPQAWQASDTAKKVMQWEITPTQQPFSYLKSSTPLACTPSLGFNNIRKDLRKNLDHTESTELSTSRDTSSGSKSRDTSGKTSREGTDSERKEEKPGPIFKTPATAASRLEKERYGIRRKSTVKFNEKTVYHEYKTNSRIKSSRSDKKNMNLAYGGRGENPGVVTTVAELTGEEVKCEECYVVISSYSSLKHGRWGVTPVSVVQTLTHRDINRTHTLMLFREMDILSLLRHPYIVQLLGVCSGPRTKDVMLVLEPVSRGTLYTTLHKQRVKLCKQEIVNIAHNICCALDYVHRNGYIHNGVSSHSIFLGKEAKLGNMGYVQPASTSMTFNTGHFWQWSDVWINEEPVSTESDVYSVGCVLWECLTGKVPWSGLSRENVILHVCKGKKLGRPKREGALASITMQILSKKITSIKHLLQQLEGVLKKK